MIAGLESDEYLDTILKDVSCSKTSVNDRQTYSFPKIWARAKMRWGCHWLGLLPPGLACFGLRLGRLAGGEGRSLGTGDHCMGKSRGPVCLWLCLRSAPSQAVKWAGGLRG